MRAGCGSQTSNHVLRAKREALLPSGALQYEGSSGNTKVADAGLHVNRRRKRFRSEVAGGLGVSGLASRDFRGGRQRLTGSSAALLCVPSVVADGEPRRRRRSASPTPRHRIVHVCSGPIVPLGWIRSPVGTVTRARRFIPTSVQDRTNSASSPVIPTDCGMVRKLPWEWKSTRASSFRRRRSRSTSSTSWRSWARPIGRRRWRSRCGEGLFSCKRAYSSVAVT